MTDVILVALGKQRHVPNTTTLFGEQFLNCSIIKVCHDVAEVVIQRPVLIYFDRSIFKRYPIILADLFQHGMVTTTMCGILCRTIMPTIMLTSLFQQSIWLKQLHKSQKQSHFTRNPTQKWHALYDLGRCLLWKINPNNAVGMFEINLMNHLMSYKYNFLWYSLNDKAD